MTIRIHLVENHKVVREGIRRVLETEPDLKVVEESDTAEEAQSKLSRGKWDVTILDLNLPGKSGIDTIEVMCTKAPGIPILILTMHPASTYAVQAIRAGASGYLTKDCDGRTLIEAVRTVHGGRKYLSPEAASALADAIDGKNMASYDKLSPREMEVLLLTARGFTTQQIAGTLNIGISTVDTYRRRILQKLDLNNIREMAGYAYRHHLLE